MIKLITIILFISVSLLGCNEPVSVIESPPPPRHDLNIDGKVQFHGEISWSARDNSIETQIWAENVGSSTARIETGVCSFHIIAYNADYKLVWYNRLAENVVCLDELLVYKISPGETVQLTGQSYISGSFWYQDIPSGDWNFEAQAFTTAGDTVAFELN
ncbi:MAG TPA: hypothetical protein VJ877_00215 [Bacteroidales bacterium]|nr:hypothetical protein [Bacteroidales bacterium]